MDMMAITLSDVIAELIWPNVRDSKLTEEELRRYLEAYHMARQIEAEAQAAKEAERREIQEEEFEEWLRSSAILPAAPEQPEPEPEPPAKPGNTSSRGAKSLETRKNKVLDGIGRHRAAGVSLQGIADAGRGLTLTDVMDAVERKVLPLPKWTALEKAVAALDKRAAVAAAEGET